jgi:cytochrome P450
MTHLLFTKITHSDHGLSDKSGHRAPGPQLYQAPYIMYRLMHGVLDFAMETHERYGDVVLIPTIFGPFYLLTHPDGVRHVLQENHLNYNKDVVDYDLLRLVLGKGLLTNDGASWLHQRRLIQPGFHRQRIAGFGSLMVKSTQIWLERWDTSEAIKRGEPLNMAYEITSLTLYIVGRALFGADVSKETDRIGQALTGVNHLIGVAFYLPWLLFLQTPQRRRLDAWRREMHTVVDELIRERRLSQQQHDDLLDMLLRARDEETGERMDDRQLHDEVLTLLLAGHETTANALLWTFFLLAQHSHVEEKLRDEYQRVLNGRAPTIEDLSHLPYNRMVIEESMRLYPPAWGLGRRSLKEDEISGYTIPKGAYVSVLPYVTHRHPAFWERPDEFIPERFSSEQVNERPRYAYFPFGGGPRLCIGNQFALYEAQLVLATILQSYRLSLVPGTTVIPEPLITLRPKGGLPMLLRHV